MVQNKIERYNELKYKDKKLPQIIKWLFPYIDKPFYDYLSRRVNKIT
jgi:hypothetical protein